MPNVDDLLGSDDIQSLMLGDLHRSGLEPNDLRASPIGATERMLCEIGINVQGYTIPYTDLGGKPLGFYRVRLFDQTIKYKQLKDTPNHVYFPRNFLGVFRAQASRPPYIVLTEGEKKAALACKFGIPCIAFGGVDSWRNRTLLIPKATEFKTYKHNPNLQTVKIAAGSGLDEYVSGFAKGFEDLCNFGLKYGVQMIIIYDSDTAVGVQPQVQRAASALGYELRHRGFGIKQIRQLILPQVEGLESVSLDDYLVSDAGGPGNMKKLIRANQERRSAFPRHPNAAEYIEKQLASPRIGRAEMQNITLSVIAELDSMGRRMYAKETQRTYYFNDETSELLPVNLNVLHKESIQSTAFGRLLYQKFGIVPAADNRLTQFLGAQYIAEEPIEDVQPHKIFARPNIGEDIIRYQISQGQYIKVTGDKETPFEVLDNGAENVLFESTLPDNLDPQHVGRELTQQMDMPLSNWWLDVLETVRLREVGNHRKLLSLLYYISPWLYRWRGTQLPVELIVGEAGSGKSTLCELRLEIILGQSALRPAPSDVRDWHASIVSTGGIHVTDNVQFADKTLRQRISDDLCRLITEPDPHIEMRRLYTEAENVRMKVDPIFVFTGIRVPFHQSDLLQRSIIAELDKSTSGDDIRYAPSWKADWLRERGGRISWVCHHLVVLHKFLEAAKTKWDVGYEAKHRLVNLEQILVVMARDVFGMEHDWIANHLAAVTDDVVASTDITLLGLCAYVDEWIAGGDANMRGARVSTKDIVEWAKSEDDYKESYILNNSRALGHYLVGNRFAVASIAGLVENGKYGNRAVYRVVKTARHKIGDEKYDLTA